MALTGGQKFCLWMVIFGALAVMAGSVAPFWVTWDIRVYKGTYGLWFACYEAATTEKCEDYDWPSNKFNDFSAWFYVVHAAAGLATLICLVLVLLSLIKVCGESDSTKSVGSWALSAGPLGIAASVIFYLEMDDALAIYKISEGDKDWAFIVFTCGAGVLTVFGIILLALPNSGTSRVAPVGHR